MPFIARTVATLAIARRLAGHPLVRAGIAAAPKLATPEAKAKALEVAKDAAYGAGAMTRRLMDKVQGRR